MSDTSLNASKPASPSRLPVISRNTGSYVLLIVALVSAFAVKDKDLIEKVITALLDAGLLVWNASPGKADSQ